MGRNQINAYDNARSWILPDHVCSNIPLRGSEGMLGAHNAARGLLVEIFRPPARSRCACTTTRPRTAAAG
jgi:hypothetical protein